MKTKFDSYDYGDEGYFDEEDTVTMMTREQMHDKIADIFAEHEIGEISISSLPRIVEQLTDLVEDAVTHAWKAGQDNMLEAMQER